MSDLFLPTLEMMGLTFAIGFFVAFIIKLIASAADSLDFYSSHQQELLRLRRIKKFRQKMELILHTPSMHGNIFGNDTREDYSRGVDRENEKPRGYYHGVRSGRSRALLPSSPLRTVREGFPSYGSSFSKSLFVCRDRLILLLVSIVFYGII